MEIVLKDTELVLEADTSLIEQVLINLVVNSVEAVKDSTNAHIMLSAFRASDNRVILKVSDNGAGMPQEVLEKVFIPFFSTKKSGGGIGLSLCKQIMMLHKGNIQIQSVQGKGSSFSLQF